MTSASANTRRNVMESALARTPAGGPECCGVASGIATIGLHAPGSGHAHGGGLINAAVSGAMSDVAFGTPFCMAGRPAMVPAMAPLLAATLLFVPYDALSRYLARVTPLPNCLGCVMPCMCCGWRHFSARVWEKAVAELTAATSGASHADAGFHVFSDSFPVMFGRRRIPLAETTAIISRPPLLITALTMLSAPLLRESAEKIQWAAALGFAGVLLIIRPGASVFDPAVFPPCRA